MKNPKPNRAGYFQKKTRTKTRSQNKQKLQLILHSTNHESIQVFPYEQH